MTSEAKYNNSAAEQAKYNNSAAERSNHRATARAKSPEHQQSTPSLKARAVPRQAAMHSCDDDAVKSLQRQVCQLEAALAERDTAIAERDVAIASLQLQVEALTAGSQLVDE